MKIKVVILGLLFIGCAEQTDSVFVKGEDGISMGIDILSNAPSCTSNGITVRTFVDTNRNGELDVSELVKKVSVVCNGVDGNDGESVSLSVATSEQCSTGGVVVNDTPICNGIDGSMGPQGERGLRGARGPRGVPGIAGPQGEQGIAGEIGAQGPAGLNTVSGVVPVQLCPGDTASFKEYGLFIDNELYAVYHNNAAGHTFLAQLSVGTYITTNGSNCRFTYTKTPTPRLTNSSGTVLLSSKTNSGLLCNVHDMSNWNGVTNILTTLTQNPPVGSFVMSSLNLGNSQSSNGFPGMPSNLQNLVGTEGYALDCTGKIDIPTSGMYQFSMLVDDGVRMMIDGEVLINSPQLQAPTVRTSSVVELQKGKRNINVIYYQGPRTQIALELKFSGPFLSLQVVPSSVLSH